MPNLTPREFLADNSDGEPCIFANSSVDQVRETLYAPHVSDDFLQQVIDAATEDFESAAIFSGHPKAAKMFGELNQ